MSGRIVVGVDGSEEARLATHWAAREARLRGAKLELVSAWEVPSFAYGYASEFVATAGDLAKDLEKVTEDQLEVALEDVRTEEADADVEARAVEGQAARMLLEASRDADLLVVGSRGRGGFRELLLGSVSQACARHATCPVVIVRHLAGEAGSTPVKAAQSMEMSRKEADTKVLYTAEAVVQGGRGGHGRTTDGRLGVELSVPEELGGQGGGGTNPEQLFALGYAACFQSTLLSLARGRNLDASDSTVTARVGIGLSGHGGFGLAVALDLHAPHLTRADAEDLMAGANERCPYSNATRGNVDVTLTVDGRERERSAA
jgi:osmotically inducible protein OsmC